MSAPAGTPAPTEPRGRASAPAAPSSPADAADPFVRRFRDSLADDSFVRLVLSSPAPNTLPVERILGRLVTLKDRTVLSLTERQAKRDTTRNLDLVLAGPWLAEQLNGPFRAALLGTRTRDWQWSRPEGGPPRIQAHPPAKAEPSNRDHDRAKHRVLEANASADWLEALGLADRQGRILPSRAAKHRQILRYAEILGHLVRDAGFAPESTPRVADMGCGKGYLTFATWHLFRRVLGLPADVTGIELRPELASDAEAKARALGLDGLHFRAGSIAEAAFTDNRLDVLIALHACNTATDDAIRRGIGLGCRLIVVAPCCHQELRPKLGHPEPLAPILRHGLMAERFAEWLTDGLRALHLEWAGYDTRIIEFVGSEHTQKNLLLAALRNPSRVPFADPTARQRIEQLEQWGLGGVRIRDAGSGIQDSGSTIQDSRSEIRDPGCMIHD